MKLHIFLLVLLGLLTYVSILPNGFIDDDYFQIVQNPLVRSIQNIPGFFAGSTYFRPETGQSYGLYYRPLMLSIYTLMYRLFGSDPLFFHLASIMLHIANALLIYLLLRKYISPSIAFGVCALFLVHPINQEVVAYIADLQDVLFVFFGLISFVILNLFQDLKKMPKLVRHDRMLSIAGFLLLSLFSKESGVLFLLMIVWYTFLFARKKLKTILILSCVVFCIYAFFRFHLAGSHITDSKLTPISQATLGERLLNSPKIIITYVSLLIFPRDLSLNQMWMVKSIQSREFWLPLILIVIIGLLMWLVLKLSSRPRGYRTVTLAWRDLLFFSGWILVGLLLHIQIIPLNATFTTRWFYFPTVGVVGIVGVLVAPFLKKYKLEKRWIRVLFFGILILCILRTTARNLDWYNEMTLFSRDIKSSGGNYYLENNLASILIQNKKYSQAKGYVVSSIRQFPYFGNINNMALLLVQEKKYDEAQDFFLRALTMRGNYMVYQNYANFLLTVKDDPKGAKLFIEKNIRLYPNSSNLWFLLARSNARIGAKDQAVAAAQNGCQVHPGDECGSVMKEAMESGNKPL